MTGMDDTDLMEIVDFYGPANTRRIKLAQDVGLSVGWEEDDLNVRPNQIGYRNNAALAIVPEYDQQVWPQIYPTPPIMIEDPRRNRHGLGYESDGYQD